MNQNRLMTVLRAPVISEKSTFVAEKNEQVVFEVLQMQRNPKSKQPSNCSSRFRSRACRCSTARQGEALRPCHGRRSDSRRAYVAQTRSRDQLRRGGVIHHGTH